MKIELNEAGLLSEYLKGNCKDENKNKVAKLLVKHCHSLGMDKVQAKDFIVCFMEKHMRYFVLVKFENVLDDIIENQYKYENELVKVENVYITKKELEIISNINNVKLEQLAFTYLVYAKVFNKIKKNNNGWVNTKQSGIFKDAKVTKTIKEQNFMICDLIELNILKDAIRNDNLSKQVLIINEESKNEIIVDRFRDEDNFVYYYLKWKGENIINCQCGKLIKPKNNKMKYCKECANRIKNKQINEIKRRKKEQA